MSKILIIQTAFIGDVVLATCLAEKIHAHDPATEIDFLVRRGNESLFTSHPFINEVIIWNKKENKYLNLFRILKLMQKKKYDRVINVQRFFSTGMLTAFSGAKEKIGFDKNPFSSWFDVKVLHKITDQSKALHETERNLLLIRHFTNDQFFKPRLYPSKEDQNSIDSYSQQPFITIAPASVWFTKQFPPEKWIDFIKQLPKNLNVYLLGSPFEATLCNQIVSSAQGSNVISMAGKLSLLQSAALMNKATMNYCNDSAPLHLASAVNAPVTAVFCSTLPAFGFGPLSDKKFVVEINEPLYCRPCGIHGRKKCPEKHFRCALEITNAQLLEPLNV